MAKTQIDNAKDAAITDLEQIKRTGHKIRMGFWAIIFISLVLIVGVPPIFNVHIELISENTWLFSLFSLLEVFFPQQDSLTWSIADKTILVLGFLLLSALFAMLIAAIDRLFFQYQKGEVFTKICAKYFRLIGWTLIALFAVDNLFGNWIDHAYASQIGAEDLQPQESFTDCQFTECDTNIDFLAQVIALDFTFLMAGLFVLAVARAVVLGVALQEDVDATV